MNFQNPLAVVAVALAVVAVIWALSRFFSPEAKLERRRRRSNYRISSRGKQPTVKFSVRTKKD